MDGHYTAAMKWIFFLAAFIPSVVFSQDAPAWFAQSLLDLPDEVADAARHGKRVMLYFGQPGCPYCKQLMEVNFRQRPVAERMQRDFVSIELSIFGDRELTWTDGSATTEKQLARDLKVQYTPTLLFLDPKGAVALRMNGYYLPARFLAALEGSRSMDETANSKLADEPFFLSTTDLRRKKPLAVLFETPYCAECDELHRVVLAHPAVRAQLARYDVVRLTPAGKEVLVTPGGQRMTAAAWAEALKIGYVPSLVLFDAGGTERLRMEAYFRPFHVAGSLEYVSGGAWQREPSFQRWLQSRGDDMRRRGTAPDLWN
jgi:thioredoxin-related protein